MLAQVALVGRPNVGKSSLFNRLSHRRAALVSSIAGTTVDRLFERVSAGGKAFTLIDSPGNNPAKGKLAQLITQQAEKAWQKADLALLVCERQRHSEDERILTELLHHGVPVILVINKLDHQASSAELAEFYRYQLPLLGVSAQSGLGLTELLRHIRDRIDSVPAEDETRTHITILGCPNAGKSTLANRLVGTREQLVYKEPGTTRDNVKLDFSRQGKDYRLIDTAGIRRRAKIGPGLEKMAVAAALHAASRSDVIIFMIDAGSLATNQDKILLQLLERLGKGLVIAINKIDLLPVPTQKKAASLMEEKLRFVDYADIHLISATQNKRISSLMRSVNQAYAMAGSHWKTPLLNKLLRAFSTQQQPPLIKGKQGRLLYAHQIDTHPPSIVIHGKRMSSLPAAYKRYLLNQFSRSLGLRGVPLRLEFRNDAGKEKMAAGIKYPH